MRSAQQPIESWRASIEPLAATDSGVTIFVRDLAVNALVGVYEHERQAPQMLMLDLDIELGANRGGQTDTLVDTLDYADVVSDLRSHLAETSYSLLERLAEFAADRILNRFHASSVTVQIAKIGVLPGVRAVGVRIKRSSVPVPAPAKK